MKFKTYKDVLDAFKKLHVTGVLKNGKRFKRQEYTCNIINLHYVLRINLWRGTVWGVDDKGKRTAIKFVWN